MNRVIIVGNGFDLAHGLKTCYKDFIEDYLAESLGDFCLKSSFADPLLDIKYKHSAGMNYFDFSNIIPSTAVKMFQNYQSNEHLNVKITSKLLESTLSRLAEINWVDLENIYFEQLLNLRLVHEFNYTKVKSHNDAFEYMKTKLEEYLNKAVKPGITTISTQYVNLFCETIKADEVVTENLTDHAPARILVLNFNYTDTFREYQLECSKSITTDIIHIHGELGKPANPIIFGFGDEYDKEYQSFEDLKNKELLRHIKSFGYFQTSNYHNLLRFIETDKFQVFVVGHSLGLSDRTMLKQIFEHPKCKSIKLFYHKTSDGKDDYTDKTYAISSHFSDKISLRSKLISKVGSVIMPQV